MPAYLIGTININDPRRWQEYVDRVGATFEIYGGRVLFRGVKASQLNGEAHGDRVVVAEFDDSAALKRWHDSAQYQQLIAMRNAGADVVLTAYQS
ncbi:MAG: DUF1330 domain-containing protein [Burkholderiaceae bacterium]